MHNSLSLRRRQANRFRFLKIGAVSLALLFTSIFVVVAVQGAVNHDHVATTLGAAPFLAAGGLILRDKPDEGTGGSSSQDAPPTWAPSDTAPEIEGDTFEKKVDSSKSIIGSLFGKLKDAWTAFKTLQGDNKTLQTQFDALKETAQAEKDAHTATKGLLAAEKTAHTETSGKLVKADANVTRLESLCDLKGIDKDQVVAPASNAGGPDEERVQLVANLDKAKTASERGAAAEALRKFDAKQKARKAA